MEAAVRRLSALFIVGAVLFFSPLVGAFNRGGTLWGLPLLPLYLFAAWGGVIAAAFLVSAQKKP